MPPITSALPYCLTMVCRRFPRWADEGFPYGLMHLRCLPYDGSTCVLGVSYAIYLVAFVLMEAIPRFDQCHGRAVSCNGTGTLVALLDGFEISAAQALELETGLLNRCIMAHTIDPLCSPRGCVFQSQLLRFEYKKNRLDTKKHELRFQRTFWTVM